VSILITLAGPARGAQPRSISSNKMRQITQGLIKAGVLEAEVPEKAPETTATVPGAA
jgi:hypothetical protein